VKCPECGAEVAPGDVFCGNCGKMVLAEESAVPSPPPPSPPTASPADRARKAMTISIILVSVGAVLCLAGLIASVVVTAMPSEEYSLAESALVSAICCLAPFALPGTILAIIGGVVWFVWGRDKG